MADREGMNSLHEARCLYGLSLWQLQATSDSFPAAHLAGVCWIVCVPLWSSDALHDDDSKPEDLYHLLTALRP